MSDLNLTPEQLTELAGMGIAGQMAADDLKKWREGMQHEIVYDSSEECVRYSCRTAELRAAAVYFEGVVWKGDIWDNHAFPPEGLDEQVADAKAKLDTIAKAYAEIKQ